MSHLVAHLCLQDQNVFDSKRKVKLTSAEGVEYKLAKKQLQAIDFNKALLAMYTNQVRMSPWTLSFVLLLMGTHL